MREADNIRKVEALGVNMMGFIFWPKSSRYVGVRPAYLPSKVKRVGVFVDEDIKTVEKIANDYALDYIQLHGHESPAYCKLLKERHLIKAISINNRDDIKAYQLYEGLVDYFLFDTKAQLPGGSGQQFDWNVLSAYDGNTPFLLSGGIGPDDVEVLTSNLSPLTSKKCIGIDLNSRFEQAPGLKDTNKLYGFIKAIRK